MPCGTPAAAAPQVYVYYRQEVGVGLLSLERLPDRVLATIALPSLIRTTFCFDEPQAVEARRDLAQLFAFADPFSNGPAIYVLSHAKQAVSLSTDDLGAGIVRKLSLHLTVPTGGNFPPVPTSFGFIGTEELEVM